MTKYLALVMAFYSLSVSAQNCEAFKINNFSEVKTDVAGQHDINFKNMMFLAEFEESLPSSEIIDHLNSEKSLLMLAVEKCVEPDYIFFDILIESTGEQFLKGFFSTKNDKYFSGPHLLSELSDEPIFIQADKRRVNET